MAYGGTLTNLEQPSFGERIAMGLGGAAQSGGQGIVNLMAAREQAQKDEQVNKLLGDMTGRDPNDFKGLSPDMRRDLLKEASSQKGRMEQKEFDQKGRMEIERLKGEKKGPSKEEIKSEEKVRQLEGAKERLNKMREIRAKGNLGVYVKGGLHHFGGETARDKGSYEQLGKSLIQLSTTIPIRNRLEFETLADRLYDSSITDAESEGVLDAMEEIIENSIYEASGNEIIEEEFEMESQGPGKELTQEEFDKIWEQAGEDPKKAKRIAKKMGFKL
jgi:hypothetical protein